MIKVIKLGGAVLKNPEDLKNIGDKIIKLQKNNSICVILSAMGNTTNELYSIFKNSVCSNFYEGLEEFVGYGEIMSVSLFASVLRSLGFKKAEVILPWMKHWPLWVSIKDTTLLLDKKGNQEIRFQTLCKSKEKIKKYILPLIKKRMIPLLPGFIAKNKKGEIITLGRGGSDISAFLIAELLNANEVVLVKDVSGVLSKDPELAPTGTRKIKTISASELGIMTHSGSRVIHPSSLKHTKRLKRARIVSSFTKDWDKSGTEIIFEEDAEIEILKTPLSVLTLLGKNLLETPGILSEISGVLAKSFISIYGITLSESFLAIYVRETDGIRSYSLLHKLIDKLSPFSSISLKQGIAKIRLNSLKFINEPGTIEKIIKPIAKEGINIWELVTVHTEISIFLEKESIEKVSKITKKIFVKENV